MASPVSAPSIDLDRIMTLSERLCGGASLNADKAEGLVALLRGESDVLSTLDELEAIDEFTDEAIAAASPEARELASNILQYWFLGRWSGEPVENRAEMYFDLASWQTLPYSTQQSTCKSFGYWAVDIEL